MRDDFPIFKSPSRYKAYLDNAATTHKPQQVIDAMMRFYAQEYAAVHRGSYALSEAATASYEAVRAQVACFIGAKPEEIVFTKGATEGINLVAYSWALQNLGPNDEIIVSQLEHHANLLPWQMVAQKTGSKLSIVPIEEDGTLSSKRVIEQINTKTKLVALTHMSHVLGALVDIAPISSAAHAVGAKVLVDAAQSAPQGLVDVNRMGADFLVFSGHKMMGPTGVGVLFIKEEIAHTMPPFQFGGGMVFEVDSDKATWLKTPHCFEAGTPPIAQVIGLGAALDYRATLDWSQIRAHEAALTSYAIDRLAAMPKVHLLGPLDQLRRSGHLLSFIIDGYHPHDIGAFFDSCGIAVRTGDHCAQPLAKALGISGSIRLSFYCYTSQEELTYALDCLESFLTGYTPFDRLS